MAKPKRRKRNEARAAERRSARSGASTERARAPAPPRHSPAVTTALALGFALLLGGFLRLDNLATWQEQPALHLADGRPILGAIDGYYYLDLARDWLEDDYAPRDAHAAVPVGRARPRPLPLLSLLLAGGTIGGASLDWVGAVLPALLATLLAFPVYAFGRSLAGPVAGAAAASVAMAAPIYVQRSRAGFLDTDCLNLAFCVAIAWCCLHARRNQGTARAGYAAAAMASWALFLWWWDQGATPATLAFLAPAALAALLAMWERRRDPQVRRALLLGGAVFAAIALFLLSERSLGILRYVVAEPAGPFPSSAGAVAEQRAASFERITTGSAGSLWGFVVGASGWLLLALRRRGDALLLAFPLIVGLLSVTAARFVVFLVPVIAIGVGVAAAELHRRAGGGMPGALAALALVASLLGPILVDHDLDDRIPPRRLPYQVAAFEGLAQRTPEDAVVWSFWGHGYPIQYYGRRATLADGSHRSGKLLYLLDVPLAASDFRLAANWMGYFAHHGPAGLELARELLDTASWPEATAGLRQLLARGPEGAATQLRSGGRDAAAVDAALAALFPSTERPIVLFQDFGSIRMPWIRYGTWDLERGEGQRLAHQPFADLRATATGRAASGLAVDAATGVARLERESVPLGALGGPDGSRSFGREGPVFWSDVGTGFGWLADPPIAGMVGYRLYTGDRVDARYFELIESKLPSHRLYRVVPEVAAPASPGGES